jgi:very-short-patch-repair endonuclease
MHRALIELLHPCGGVIGRRHYPELATQMDSALRRGELVGILPGVYAHRDVATDWRTLVRAVAAWDERAVIVGEAPAALTYWPELTPQTVEVAGRRARLKVPGISFSRRSVPAELVVQLAGVKMSSPALTALDLVPRHGGEGIDRALRSRMTTLPAMHRALQLTPGRDGNTDRRLMLLDSRGNPWSEGERLAHRLLRGAGITRWHANVPIICDGHTFFQDIAMDDNPVVIEVDGKIHLREDLFEYDRRRGNYLLLEGKQVLHFTWRMLNDEPAWFVSMTERAIDRYA